ncbi:MAG: hypothetical protein HRU41_35425 [Saprospiraceae bacterium]|nr:hypothetical protein [Saprospiraceae bacterium]
MLKLKLLIPILLLSILTSCGKKEALVIPIFDPPVLTGYHLRDENGQPLGNVGAPNTNTSTDPPGIANPLLEFFSYPNPSRGNFFQTTVFSGIASNDSVRVWMTPARYIDEINASNTLGATLASSHGRPLRELTLELEEGFNNIAINTEDLPAGYYRIYVQRGSLLLWDNLLIRQ